MFEYKGKVNFSINIKEVVIKKYNSNNNPQDYKNKIIYLEKSITSILDYFLNIKGIVLKEGSILSHVAIVSRELKMPSIIGVEDDFDGVFSDEIIVSIEENNIIISKQNYLLFSDRFVRISKQKDNFLIKRNNTKIEIDKEQYNILKKLQKENLEKIDLTEETKTLLEKLINKKILVFSRSLKKYNKE